MNQVVGADVMSAYLGTPSKDALNLLAGHMSLTRDPRDLAKVRERELSQIHDPEMEALGAKRVQLKADIIARFGLITRSHGTSIYEEYYAILTDLRNRRKQLKRETFNFHWKTYYANVGCNEIDRQRRGGLETSFIQDKPSFALEERESLASLLCRNDDVDNISKATAQENRNEALRYMIRLCFRCEAPRQTYQRSGSIEVADEDKMDEERECPKTCQGLQCPWCFHNEALPATSRNFAFCNLDTLRRHIAHQHLRHRTLGSQCPYRCEISRWISKDKIQLG